MSAGVIVVMVEAADPPAGAMEEAATFPPAPEISRLSSLLDEVFDIYQERGLACTFTLGHQRNFVLTSNCRDLMSKGFSWR